MSQDYEPTGGSDDLPPNTSEPGFSESEERALSGASDTPETVEVEEETDEQKNERALQERQARSERAARGVQRRIDELTADKHSERAAREALQRELDELRRGQSRTAVPQVPGVNPNAEPQKADFDDWEQYSRATARWEARQEAIAVANAVQERAEHQQRIANENQREAQLNHGYSNAETEFVKQRPDYHEKMAAASNVMIPRELGSAIKALPNGPAVALFVAENPQIAEALANQPVVMQGIVLGNISAQLQTSQVSNAPRPGRPVGGSGSSNDAPPADAAAYARWAAKRGM